MNRRVLAGVLTIAALSLTACGGGEDDDPVDIPTSSSSATPNQEEAAIAAFDAYYDERTTVMNTEGRPPKDALSDTVTGAYREEELALLVRASTQWTSREGEPLITKQTATVDGDTAVVRACINEDKWLIVTLEGKKVSPGQGWQSVGRELSRDGDRWSVTGAAPDGKKLTCP